MKRLLLSSLGFVALYNILFFEIGIGVAAGLFFLFLNIFYFFIKSKTKVNFNLALSSSFISIIFGFLIGFRSNELMQMVNFMLASFFSLAAAYFYKTEHIFSFEIPGFLFIPFNMLSSSFGSVKSLILLGKTSSDTQNNKLVSSLVRGFIITIPIFLILLFLFIHADPVFTKLVERFFENIWQRILFSTFLFIGLMSIGIAKIKGSSQNKEVSFDQASHKAYELIVILGSIAGLFAIFILVQFRYFFSNIGERELYQLGVVSLTYSEYVRKGFFELIAASAIAILIMIYVTKYLHKLKSAQKLWVQILSSVFILEIGLLLISATQRINLYQSSHGLTRARVFGFIFLIWLTSMLVIILLRVIKEISRKWLFKLSLFFTIVILLIANVINIDGLIATKYKPSVNGEIDYYYLSDLSADGAQSWQDALSDSKRTINNLESVNKFSAEDYRKFYWAHNTIKRLNMKMIYLRAKYGNCPSYVKGIQSCDTNQQIGEKQIIKLRKWQSFNYGEFRAYQIFLENKEQETFGQLNDLLRKADGFNNTKIDRVIRETAPLDRSTEPPLL